MVHHIKDYQVFDDNRFTKKDIETTGKIKRFVLNFKKGQVLPPHKHPNTDVFLYIVEGKGTCLFDDEKVDVSENDTLHVNGNQMISIENNDDAPLSVFVILTPTA